MSTLRSCPSSGLADRQREERRVIDVSRVVWEHVVVPKWITTTRGDNQHKFTMKRCVKIMTVAEALFPLVAKACAVVLETRDDRVGVDEGAKDFWATCQVKYRSSYFAVECAAIAGVQKGDGGGGLGTARCLRWVLEHRKSRNIKKESLAVLWGLCSSNNLLAAQQLVLNPGQSLHAGTAASCWAWDDEVRDSLRWDYNSNVPSTLLSCVCRAGHLDVAKWMVPRFGFQKWDLWGPFLAALKGGHVEVAKLLREQVYWEFMTRNDRREAQLRAADSGCIDAIDWCWPMVEVHDYFPSEAILRGLLNSPKTSEDKIEGCKYLVKQFSEQYHQPTWARLVIKEEMTLRHLIVSGLVKPSQSELECACSEICETHLLEWLIDELHIPLKKFTGWKALFRNKKDSAPVVEFMINKMGEVSEEILSHSIEDALSAGNFCVADWLEERYHRTKLGYERDLRHHTKLKNVAKYYFGSGALAWVLKHHNVPDLIGEDEVIKSVENCLLLDNFRGTLLLLNAFTIPHDNEKNIKANAMWKSVLLAIPRADIYSAQQMASVGQFTRSQVAESLTTRYSTVHSSKVAKWLISAYNLTADELRANNNSLLFHLLRESKTNCAAWFIRQFQVTLPEVLDMVRSHGCNFKTSLSTWKMLLRQFPDITADTAKHMFLDVVCASPCHIEYSIHTLGLTAQDLPPWDRLRHQTPKSTQTWLAMHRR